MSTTTDDHRSRRRRALVAWGTLAAVGAAITVAAFTDVARLNLGANGMGGGDSTYNIQVGATDADGNFVPGWQEADDPAGVTVALTGAESMFPGSEPVSVTIPVRNDSPHFGTSLTMSLAQLADDTEAGRVTDANYRSSLRFDVTMPATSVASAPLSVTGLTYAQLAGVALNGLDADEESTVTLTVRLLSQADSGADFDDNALNGKGAFLQAVLDGTSV